jgi:hypothetical protein
MTHVEGELIRGKVRSVKGTPARHNTKGEVTQGAMFVVSLELPHTSELARLLAKATVARAVDVLLEPVPERQLAMGLDKDGAPTEDELTRARERTKRLGLS